MDSKAKAIKAMSMFEIDELPEMNMWVGGKSPAPSIKAFLEERLQDAINELVEAASDRIRAMDAQAAADVKAVKERDQEQHNRYMEKA